MIDRWISIAVYCVNECSIFLYHVKNLV